MIHVSCFMIHLQLHRDATADQIAAAIATDFIGLAFMESAQADAHGRDPAGGFHFDMHIDCFPARLLALR